MVMENLFILGQVLSFLKVGCRHDWSDLREVGQQVNVYLAAPDVAHVELPAIRHEPQWAQILSILGAKAVIYEPRAP